MVLYTIHFRRSGKIAMQNAAHKNAGFRCSIGNEALRQIRNKFRKGGTVLKKFGFMAAAVRAL